MNFKKFPVGLFILLIYLVQTSPTNSQVSEFLTSDRSNSDIARSAKKISSVEKTITITVGIIGGAILGGFVGSQIDDDWISTFRGAAIGICVFPFLNYDLMLARNKIDNPLNQYGVLAGRNRIFVSHADARERSGYLIGINRIYHLGGKTFFRGELLYNQRKFDLINKKSCYSSMSGYRVGLTDIYFKVDYIDVNLLLDVVVHRSQSRSIHIGAGPAISMPVQRLTKYDWIEIREVDHPAVGCDFHFIGEEPGETFLFLGSVWNLEFQYKRLALRLRFNYGLDSSYQIYPLHEETKMNSLELLAGFRL